MDLVVISANLKPYLTKVLVDKDQKLSAKKVLGKGKVVKSDHFPIIVTLEEMPKAKLKKSNEASWNINKPDGWKTNSKALEDTAKGLEAMVEDENLTEEDVVKKFDAITTKAKFRAFGKSKPPTKKAHAQRMEDRLKAAQGLDDEVSVKELMRKQYDTMEAEINRLKESKFGRVTNIFKIKDIIAGAKKRPQEAHAVLDAEKRDHVVSTEEIKKVTLRHVMNTFKRVAPHEDVELVTMVNDAHDKRRIEADEEELDITEDDFDELLGKLEKRTK